MNGYIWKFYLTEDWDEDDILGLVKVIKLEFSKSPNRTYYYRSPTTGRNYRFSRIGKIVEVVETIRGIN